eukprot:g11157.t1
MHADEEQGEKVFPAQEEADSEIDSPEKRLHASGPPVEIGSATAQEQPPAQLAAPSSSEKVQVAVRIRPLIAREVTSGCRECVTCVNGSSTPATAAAVATSAAGASSSSAGPSTFEPVISIGNASNRQRYTFDYVFGTDATQQQIFDTCCRPLVAGVFDGLNASLLAYGQTSAGKTYTLGSFAQMSSGQGGIGDAGAGMIPKFVHELFAQMEKFGGGGGAGGGVSSGGEKFLVRCSFLELHNEELNDLLCSSRNEHRLATGGASAGPPGGGIAIREDKEHGVVVYGIREVEARTAADLLRVLERGALYRTTGVTLMNDYSSSLPHICAPVQA